MMTTNMRRSLLDPGSVRTGLRAMDNDMELKVQVPIQSPSRFSQAGFRQNNPNAGKPIVAPPTSWGRETRAATPAAPTVPGVSPPPSSLRIGANSFGDAAASFSSNTPSAPRSAQDIAAAENFGKTQGGPFSRNWNAAGDAYAANNPNVFTRGGSVMSEPNRGMKAAQTNPMSGSVTLGPADSAPNQTFKDGAWTGAQASMRNGGQMYVKMNNGGMPARPLETGPKPNPLNPSAPQTPIPDWMRYSLRDGGMPAGLGGAMDRAGPVGRSMGEYWSESNAQFEAGKPSTLDRVARAVSPLTGLGSAVGAMRDAASKGSGVDMGVAAVQAIPSFAVTRRVKQVAGPMMVKEVANTGKTLGATSAATAGSVAADEMQARKPGLRDGGQMRMARGGPQSMPSGHGGAVPGTGEGDKIDAKYEPGEFVVSNDMLDAEPELAEYLHDLREEVLAKKGMTPEEADAKAITPRGLRAVYGLEGVPDDFQRIMLDPRFAKTAPDPANFTPPKGSVNAAYGDYSMGGATNPDGSATNRRVADRLMDAERAYQESGHKNYKPNFTTGQPPPAGGPIQARPNFINGNPEPMGAPGRVPERGALALRSEPVSRGAPKFMGMAEDVSRGARMAKAARGAGQVVGAALRNPVVQGLGKAFVPANLGATIYDVADTETSDYAKRFGVDYKDTNFAKDLGLRALGAGSDVLNSMSMGLLGSTFADKNGRPQAAQPAAQVAQPAAQAAPAAPKDFAEANAAKLAQANAESAGKLNDIRNVDNEAGTMEVFTKGGQGGSVAGWTTVSTPEAKAARALRDEAYTQKLADDAAAERGRIDRATQVYQKMGDADARNQLRDNASWNPRAAKAYTALMASDAAVRGSEMQLEGTRAQAAAKLRGDELQAGATLRASENTARTARAAAQASAAKDQRDYELNVAKFGVEQANQKRDDRAASMKTFNDNITKFAGVTADGKPNEQVASELRVMANAYMAQGQAKAQQMLKKDPNNQNARRFLATIDDHGLGALDESDLRKIMVDFQGNQVAKEYDGWKINPLAGKAVNSTAPMGSLRLQTGNMLWPNQYVSERGDLIPQRAVERNPDLLERVVRQPKD